jgi:hypothetical protein
MMWNLIVSRYCLATWLIFCLPLEAFFVDVYMSDTNEQVRLEIMEGYEIERLVLIVSIFY